MIEGIIQFYSTGDPMVKICITYIVIGYIVNVISKNLCEKAYDEWLVLMGVAWPITVLAGVFKLVNYIVTGIVCLPKRLAINSAAKKNEKAARRLLMSKHTPEELYQMSMEGKIRL